MVAGRGLVGVVEVGVWFKQNFKQNKNKSSQQWYPHASNPEEKA